MSKRHSSQIRRRKIRRILNATNLKRFGMNIMRLGYGSGPSKKSFREND